MLSILQDPLCRIRKLCLEYAASEAQWWAWWRGRPSYRQFYGEHFLLVCPNTCPFTMFCICVCAILKIKLKLAFLKTSLLAHKLGKGANI